MHFPLIIAHRAQLESREPNQADGIARCLKAGITGVEIDVRMHRGQMVLSHDRPHKQEVPDPIEAILPEARQLEFLLLDVKTAEVAAPVAEWVKQVRLQNVIFCSTRIADLRKVLDILPQAWVSYSFPEDNPRITSHWWLIWIAVLYILVSRVFSRLRVRRWSRLFDINQFTFSYRICSRRLIKQSTQLGLPIMVWTVNDPKHAAGWIRAGAAAVITDYPLLAQQAIKQADLI